MKNKNLIVILCYCDTQEKLDILQSTISILKNNFNILISSHSPLPTSIQSQIDYFVYDQSNPILRFPERGMKFWKTVGGQIKISHIKEDYGWTVFNLIKNAISLNNNLDYPFCSFINYDTKITNEILELLNDPKDFICSNYIDPATNQPLFPGLLLNILSKDNIIKVDSLLSKSDYVKQIPNTQTSMYNDAESYWESILENFKYKKTEVKVKGTLECGSPDVLNYNKYNTNFKLFFSVSNKQLLIYDNFNNLNIKINVNGENIILKQINEVINLPDIKYLGIFIDSKLVDITNIYTKDKLNKIENL